MLHHTLPKALKLLGYSEQPTYLLTTEAAQQNLWGRVLESASRKDLVAAGHAA